MKDDNLALSEELGRLLKQLGLRVTMAESCTGGGIASSITTVAGSSQWFEAGWVVYSNRMKASLLDVKQDVLDKYGAVSEPVTEQMLLGALTRSNADIGVAVSGIAGPTGATEDKPLGTVCFSWGNVDNVLSETQIFSGDRNSVQNQSVSHSLRKLIEFLQ